MNSPESTPCESPWLSPCAASAFHTYQYGGTYDVTLTVTDVGGNTASVTQTGHREWARRQPNGSGGPSSGAPGSTSTSTAAGTPAAAGGSAAGHAPVPPPIAAAAIPKQTLHSAVQKGLVVRYSVNEQVAGHFEVLLSRAIGTPTSASAARRPSACRRARRRRS